MSERTAARSDSWRCSSAAEIQARDDEELFNEDDFVMQNTLGPMMTPEEVAKGLGIGVGVYLLAEFLWWAISSA